MTNELSGVAVIIVIAIGFLTFVLLFIFGKRQIMRFALKTRRGPHFPIGFESPKHLKREIERRFEVVANTKQEPQLIHNIVDEKDLEETNHIYRMKAIDALQVLETTIVDSTNDASKKRPKGQDLRFYLMKLVKEGEPLNGCETKLIHQFVDAYNHARHEPLPLFCESEYNEYMNLLCRLKDHVISRRSKKYSNPSTPQHNTKNTQVTLNGRTTVTFVNSEMIPLNNEKETNETSV
ncbi:hypothetical protein B4U80_04245 [Leptotrombidium deliense]|uniref:Uncharacterized protein n=1 Tax=Leptotrombidium deliense TaxID=299467 RepID=A0A443SKM8_9ACAR|nr:hypothetical protein B4U80_04245 [Leptotrombidium deliense]